MTTSKNRKEELISKLKNKEYRDAFVSSHINNGVPFQIRALREQREWTQEKLAKISKKKQAAICRLENPNYGSFTLATLKEMASAFDVALMVRFVPFSKLVEWDIKLSSESLEVMSFPEEAYFQEKQNDLATNPEESKQYAVINEQEASDKVVSIADYLQKKFEPHHAQQPSLDIAL